MNAEARRLHFLLDRTTLIHGVVNRWRGRSDSPAFAQASMITWRAMRSVAGVLHSHPNQRLHPVPFQHLRWTIRVPAFFQAIYRRSDAARATWVVAHLKSLSRLIADARSATLSLEISQSLGKAQVELHHVLIEAGQPVCNEIPSRARPHLESPYLVA